LGKKKIGKEKRIQQKKREVNFFDYLGKNFYQKRQAEITRYTLLQIGQFLDIREDLDPKLKQKRKVCESKSTSPDPSDKALGASDSPLTISRKSFLVGFPHAMTTTSW